MRAHASSSSGVITPAGTVTPGRASTLGLASSAGTLVELAQAFHAGQNLALALVEPLLDVGRKEERAAGGPDAECDRHREVVLVADRHRHPRHAQLLGPFPGPAMQPDRRLTGGQAGDLDVTPADSPHAQPEDLAHRFL